MEADLARELCAIRKLLAMMVGSQRSSLWGVNRINHVAINARMLGREVSLTATNQQIAPENYARFCLMFWLASGSAAHLTISAQGMTSRSAVLTSSCCSLMLDTIKNPGWSQFRWMGRDPAATGVVLVTECFTEEVSVQSPVGSSGSTGTIGGGGSGGGGGGVLIGGSGGIPGGDF